MNKLAYDLGQKIANEQIKTAMNSLLATSLVHGGLGAGLGAGAGALMGGEGNRLRGAGLGALTGGALGTGKGILTKKLLPYKNIVELVIKHPDALKFVPPEIRRGIVLSSALGVTPAATLSGAGAGYLSREK